MLNPTVRPSVHGDKGRVLLGGAALLDLVHVIGKEEDGAVPTLSPQDHAGFVAGKVQRTIDNLTSIGNPDRTKGRAIENGGLKGPDIGHVVVSDGSVFRHIVANGPIVGNGRVAQIVSHIGKVAQQTVFRVPIHTFGAPQIRDDGRRRESTTEESRLPVMLSDDRPKDRQR